MKIHPLNFRQLWQQIFDPTVSENQQENWYFVVRICLLVGLFAVFNFILSNVIVMPSDQYEEPSILYGLLSSLFINPLALLLLPLIGCIIYFKKRSLVSWEVLPKYKYIRLLVILGVALLTWVYTTYDLNLYANQWHLTDRLLLILLACLVWRKPVFIYPFLLLLHAIIMQMTALEGFSWAFPFIPFHVVVIFSAYFFLFVLTKSNRPQDLLFFVCCVYITHYWNSGCFKLNAFWASSDQVNYLVANTYANGWLNFLSHEEVGSFTEMLSPLNWVIRPLTIFLEVGSMFILFHRQLPKVFLFGLACFHIGVFVYSGINFWMWILMDLGLLFLINRKNAFGDIFKFNKIQLLLFIALLYGNRFWQKTQPLFWYDVPMTYTYIFEAESDDGDLYRLTPGFFAPFDFQITLGNFSHLNGHKILPITWGASTEEHAKWFVQEHSMKEILDYEKEKGRIALDEERKMIFETFIKKYIENWNERLAKKNWLTFIQPPRYIWTFPSDPFANNPKPIREITVFESTSIYKDGKYEEIRKRPLLTVTVDLD